MTKPSSKEISVNLDLLRAIAVMSVYLAHLCGALHNRSFGSFGRFGVIIFFVHTSFVLMASLQRLDKPGESNASLATAFWIRRIFRIYPLSILVIVIIALFHIPPDPGLTYQWIGAKSFLSNLALSQNLTYSTDILSPLWSLPLEVQMYVMLPFAYIAIRGDRRFRSLALWILSVLLALTIPHVSERLNVFVYAPCFTAGIVAFDLIRSRGEVRKLPAWVWPVGIFAIILLFGPHDNVSLGHKMYRAWSLALLLGVLYANVKEGNSNWAHKIFHWIAEHSYGIYLTHEIVFWVAIYQMALFPMWVRILTVVAGSIGLPAILYVSIEKPLILVGGHIARRLLKLSQIRKAHQLAVQASD